MNTLFMRLNIGLVLLLLFGTGVLGQTKPQASHKNESSAAAQVLGGTGKAGLIIVGSAAKVGWEVTKFTATHAAKPAKTLVLKGGPKAAVFMLKSSGVGAKYLLPLALKLSVL